MGGLRRHIDMLATAQSWQSPLSVVAHIDLDAFYAQCQTVQLGRDPSEPLACRQWQMVIAVNYPARKYGIKRGMSAEECRKLCPQILLPHVATFRKGESQWHLHEDPDPAHYKVSLDLFRRESRKIFRIFKQRFGIVEKAGIDEGFVDLGSEVRQAALARYPQLAALSEDNVDQEHAEVPPDHINDSGTNQKSPRKDPNDAEDPSDPPPPPGFESWHDALLALGGELVAECRAQVLSELHYTCSAGIAETKLLAKLGSAFNKPNNQTVVLASQALDFLDNHRIKDAWGWGGKVGRHVLDLLGIDEDDPEQMAKIRAQSVADLDAQIQSQSLAHSVWELVRGGKPSQVTNRTTIKSMSSVKDFRRRTSLQKREDIHAWLRVFVADLCGRLSDLTADGSDLMPRTVCVRYLTPNGDQHSRQTALNASPATLERDLLNVGQQLMDQYVPLPCNFLVLEISHMEELPRERVMFQAFKKPRLDSKSPTGVPDSAITGPSINSSGSSDVFQDSTHTRGSNAMRPSDLGTRNGSETHDSRTLPKEVHGIESRAEEEEEELFVQDTWWCPQCDDAIDGKVQRQEHEDWHFAKQLAAETKPLKALDPARVQKSPATPPKSRSKPKPKPKQDLKTGKGQRGILDFFTKRSS